MASSEPSEMKGKGPARDPRTGRFIKKTISDVIEKLDDEDLDQKEKDSVLEELKEEASHADEILGNYEEMISLLQRKLAIEEMKSTYVGTEEAQTRAKQKELEERLEDEVDKMRLFRRKTIPTGTTDLDIKVAKPEEYDGTPEKLLPFLTQCELVFGSQTKKFEQPMARFLYIISYCTKGTALAWRENISIDQQAFTKDWVATATAQMKDPWDALKDIMKATFQNATLKTEAQHKILQIKQGNRRIEEYTLEFKMLAFQAHIEPIAQTMLYKQGLKWAIRSKIYESGNIPETLSDWIKRATLLDMGWREMQLEKPPSAGFQNRLRNRAMITHPQTRPRLSDEEFERRKKERLCFKCGKGGHMSNKCYVRNRVIKEEEEPNEEILLDKESFQ